VLAAQTSGGTGRLGLFCDPRLSGIAPRRNYIFRSQFYLIVGQVVPMRFAAFNQKTTSELQGHEHDLARPHVGSASGRKTVRFDCSEAGRSQEARDRNWCRHVGRNLYLEKLLEQRECRSLNLQLEETVRDEPLKAHSTPHQHREVRVNGRIGPSLGRCRPFLLALGKVLESHRQANRRALSMR